MKNSNSRLWETIQEELRSRVEGHLFNLWIRPLKCVASSPGELVLKVPNSFAQRQVREKYLDLIEVVAERLAGAPVAIQLEVAEEKVREIRKQTETEVTGLIEREVGEAKAEATEAKTAEDGTDLF